MSYTIRQVATQFHMQPSTLRYYEDQGLLTNVERTETGADGKMHRTGELNTPQLISLTRQIDHHGFLLRQLEQHFERV